MKFRYSLYFIGIFKGQVIPFEEVRNVWLGSGLLAKYLDLIPGCRLNVDVITSSPVGECFGSSRSLRSW